MFVLCYIMRYVPVVSRTEVEKLWMFSVLAETLEIYRACRTALFGKLQDVQEMNGV